VEIEENIFFVVKNDMNYKPKTEGKKRTIILMMFFFFIAPFGVVIGQSIESKNESSLVTILSTTETVFDKQEVSSDNSSGNFILWFMSTIQNPNTRISPAGENTRRQLMSSGSAPNRLLIRTFLKKAVNFESALG